MWVDSNPLPSHVSLWWAIFNTSLRGASVRELGAGQFVWSMFEKRRGAEWTLRLMEVADVFENERARALSEDHQARIEEARSRR